MTASHEYTEFLFLFNDPARAHAAADASRELGYAVSVAAGDGEGRHFQLRLRIARALEVGEHDRVLSDSLRPLMASHRGRYEGSEVRRDPIAGLGDGGWRHRPTAPASYRRGSSSREAAP